MPPVRRPSKLPGNAARCDGSTGLTGVIWTVTSPVTAPPCRVTNAPAGKTTVAPVPGCTTEPPAAWSNVVVAATGINLMLEESVTLEAGAAAAETRAREPA